MRSKFLLVDEGEVGAVKVFEHHLIALDEDARMLARDPTLITAVVGEVYLGEITAYRVFTPHENFGFSARERQRRMGALNHQSSMDRTVTSAYRAHVPLGRRIIG